MDESVPTMRFNAARVLSRSCETLLGICHGMLADTRLNEAEVRFLDLWLRDNNEIATCWPGSAIGDRIRSVLSDGAVSEEELADIKATLEDLIGGSLEQTGAAGGISTRLPLDDVNNLQIAGKSFCFTGKFLFGSRGACERAVEKKGGGTAGSITRELDYLVIGTLVSRDWAHSSHGRKIEKAVEYRSAGCVIRIVDEECWLKAINE